MKRKMRLTERDITRIVKRVINEEEINEFFKRKKSDAEKESEENAKKDAIRAFRSWFINHSDIIGRTKESIENTSDEEIVRMAKGFGRYKGNGEIHTLWGYFKHHFPNTKI